MSNLSCYLETFSCSNALLVILELFGDIPNYQIDGFYFVYTVLHLNFFLLRLPKFKSWVRHCLKSQRLFFVNCGKLITCMVDKHQNQQ